MLESNILPVVFALLIVFDRSGVGGHEAVEVKSIDNEYFG